MKTGDHSTNFWWLFFLALGENWHNNHHAFPKSAVHGPISYLMEVKKLPKWLAMMIVMILDPSFALIMLMKLLSMVTNVHLPSSAEFRAKRIVSV